MPTDLKIIDELLCMMIERGTWADLERKYNITETAMQRLREAWASGEMSEITLSLSNYFEETAS